MIYLMLAIFSSALVSLVMRLSEPHRKSGLGMLAANYAMCTLAAFALAGWEIAPADLNGFTLLLGGVSGVLYLLGFVLLQWNIKKSGVVLSATFQKLGVLVPTLAAMTLFRETPRWTQLIGIAVAVGAILLMQGKSGKSGSILGLLALLLTGGVCDLFCKVFETWGNPAHSDHYLLYTFAVALALSIVLCIVKGEKPTLADGLWGVALGVPNYMSARFLLLSLTDVPAIVVYPTFSVATIVLVTAVGALGFRERLGKRKRIALALILLALALLNL